MNAIAKIQLSFVENKRLQHEIPPLSVFDFKGVLALVDKLSSKNSILFYKRADFQFAHKFHRI